jgi:uncharacterized membrane protein YqjE
MPGTDRSIGTVVSDIVGDLQQIVRAEVRLAKTEVREELSKARRGAVLIAAGAVGLVLAVGLLLLALVYALATVWPPWAAALAVAAGVGAIGGALAMSGKTQLSRVDMPPAKTISSVKENLQWAKTRTK